MGSGVTTTASFDFAQTPTFEAGGPSNGYAGSAITVAGNTVSGSEGNGSFEFFGASTKFPGTNPTFENWYGFTVDVQAPVPEPSTWAMMIVGFAGIGVATVGAKAALAGTAKYLN